MTVDLQLAPESQIINGVGPYPVPCRYDSAKDLVVRVLDASGQQFDLAQFWVTPETHAPSGDLYLSEEDAQLYAGATLAVSRRTPPQQGWAGTSASARGLEASLDRLAMAVQDILARLDGEVPNLGRPMADRVDLTLTPSAGRVLAWSEDGAGFVPGPSSAQIQRVVEDAQYADFLKSGLLVPISEDAEGLECAVGTLLHISEDDGPYPSITLEIP